jgi:very-short-patch-repair endonuclease
VLSPIEKDGFCSSECHAKYAKTLNRFSRKNLITDNSKLDSIKIKKLPSTKSGSLKKKKPKKKKRLRLGLAEFAQQLNKNIPASEIWFRGEFERLQMQEPTDVFNQPFLGLIPDCVNHKYKYIIEVDGSIHNKAAVRARDKMRDKRFTQAGYQVFHVTAYNLAQLEEVLDHISRIRMNFDLASLPLKPTLKTKVILRSTAE